MLTKKIKILALIMISLFSQNEKVYSQITWTVHSGGLPMYNFATIEDAYAAIPQPITQNYNIVLCEDIEPYNTIELNKSGTSNFSIRITSINNAKIKGTNLNFGSTTSEYIPAIRIRGSYHSLDSLTFDEFDGRRVRMMLQINTGGNINNEGNNIVENCVFSNFVNSAAEAAISVFESSNNRIENCTFRDLNRGKRDDKLHAIYLNSHSCNNQIVNNHVVYCSGDPFVAKNSSSNNTFDRNRVDKSGGPAYYATIDGDTLCKNNLVINTLCEGPDPINGYYGAYIKRFRGGSDKNGDIGKNWIDGGNNIFTTHATNMFVDYVIGEDEAKILFIDNPLAQSQIKYNGSFQSTGSFDGVNINMNLGSPIVREDNDDDDDDIISWTSNSLWFSDESNKPRKISPIELYMGFDHSASLCPDPTQQNCIINFEKWVVENGSTPAVFEIIGAGAETKVQLTNLTADYDVFLLWSSSYYTRELLESKLSLPDNGWQFFFDNTAYISSTDPNGSKARSIRSGTLDEEFTRYLTNDEKYFIVVCPYNGATGSYKYIGKPGDKSKATYDKNISKINGFKIEEKQSVKFKLAGAYPNPFESSTNIVYTLAESSFVEIKVFSITGKELLTLVQEEKESGTHKVVWNAENIPKGSYFIQIKTPQYENTIKVMLAK